MKKLLILGMILATTVAFAFGGGGSGRKATYEPGLVAVGVHFGGNGQAGFNACKNDEDWIGGKCYKKLMG